jgi:hypothetical protein
LLAFGGVSCGGGATPAASGWSIEAAPLINAHRFWGSGARDVWAVGTNTLAHWNGTAWKQEKPELIAGAYNTGIWGSGPNDVFGEKRLLAICHQHFRGRS